MTGINKVLIVFLTVLFCAASALAQTQPVDSKTADTPAGQTKAIDLGQLDGVNYTNESFGLSVSIPSQWVVVTAQTRPQFNEEMKDLVKADDQSKQAQVRASIDRSAVLLSLTKLPAGEPNNASFMLIAERTPTAAIKNGADVLRSMKGAMTGTNFNVEFQGEPVTIQIGGSDFAVATIKNTSQFGTFMQKIYVTVKQGYALELFFTYTNAADLTTLDAVIKSIKTK